MSRQFLFKLIFSILTVAFVVVVVLLIVQLVRLRNQDGSSDASGERVTDSLKFVVFISRHGNRGARADYPDDPYPLNDTQYWPYGNDGLTPIGRSQMHKLGARVRALYNGFLNSTFYPGDMHASSTYVDRMLMSGEAFLAGLYPPRGWQLWDTALPWQPTPLYSDSPDKTVVITYCDRYLVNYDEVCEDALNTYASNITYVLNIYNNITGSNDTEVAGLNDLWHFWDKLISEETEGYTVPDWTEKLYPQPLQDFVAQMYVVFYSGNQEIVRLLVGELFDEFLDTLKSVVNGTQSERKFQYYSGHDCTIVGLQTLLGVPATSLVSMVKPASGLALELHQNQTTGQFYVQILYIDGATSDLALTLLPSETCGDPCDFDSLINSTLQYTSVTYDEECEINGSVTLANRYFPFRPY